MNHKLLPFQATIFWSSLICSIRLHVANKAVGELSLLSLQPHISFLSPSFTILIPLPDHSFPSLIHQPTLTQLFLDLSLNTPSAKTSLNL